MTRAAVISVRKLRIPADQQALVLYSNLVTWARLTVPGEVIPLHSDTVTHAVDQF
jgi:hypothetical protein